MLAVRCTAVEVAAQRADASDSGLQLLARHGQNGWEIVVGRKNWLFSDTVDGAKASANLYSLIETAKANGVEPYYYLRHIFARLPLAKTADDYAALLPWRAVITYPDK
jgi:hypothetical protein